MYLRAIGREFLSTRKQKRTKPVVIDPSSINQVTGVTVKTWPYFELSITVFVDPISLFIRMVNQHKRYACMGIFKFQPAPC
jgi:hypothetical protein